MMHQKFIDRPCGHTERETLVGLGRSRADIRYAGTCLCSACSQRLSELLAVQVEKPVVFRVRPLMGTPAQINWANKLRSQAADRLAHVYSAVADEDSRLATGIRRTIMLLFAIHDAKFWIESRTFLLNPYAFGHEVGLLIRGHFHQPHAKNTICGYAHSLSGRYLAAYNVSHLVEQYFGNVIAEPVQKAS